MNLCEQLDYLFNINLLKHNSYFNNFKININYTNLNTIINLNNLPLNLKYISIINKYNYNYINIYNSCIFPPNILYLYLDSTSTEKSHNIDIYNLPRSLKILRFEYKFITKIHNEIKINNKKKKYNIINIIIKYIIFEIEKYLIPLNVDDLHIKLNTILRKQLYFNLTHNLKLINISK